MKLLRAMSCVGLEIRAQELHLVQLKKLRQGFRIEQAVIEPLPLELFAGGKIIHWESLCALLAELTRVLHLKSQKTVLTLPIAMVRMQHIQLPIGLPHAAIEAEIFAQIAHELPGINEAFRLDYRMMQRHSVKQMDVLFSVTREEYLSHYLNCIERAGLAVKIVDVDLYALLRPILFSLSLEIKIKEVVTLICLFEDTMLVVIFNCHEILFYQYCEVSLSLNRLTQLHEGLQTCFATYSQRTGLSLNEASYSELSRCILVGHHEDYDLLTEVLRSMSTISPFSFTHPLLHCEHPLSRMMIHSLLDSQMIKDKAWQLLVACGAAMREMPPW